MSEMSVRIQRMLIEKYHPLCGDERCSCSQSERWQCCLGGEIDEIVQAVLEVMREPTKQMIAAGDAALERNIDFDREAQTTSVASDAPLEIFQAMIDEASE